MRTIQNLGRKAKERTKLSFNEGMRNANVICRKKSGNQSRARINAMKATGK